MEKDSADGRQFRVGLSCGKNHENHGYFGGTSSSIFFRSGGFSLCCIKEASPVTDCLSLTLQKKLMQFVVGKTARNEPLKQKSHVGELALYVYCTLPRSWRGGFLTMCLILMFTFYSSTGLCVCVYVCVL